MTSELWAVALIICVISISYAAITISNQWTEAATFVIEHNGTMMCQPVVCTCDTGFRNIGYMNIYENVSEGR